MQQTCVKVLHSDPGWPLIRRADAEQRVAPYLTVTLWGSPLGKRGQPIWPRAPSTLPPKHPTACRLCRKAENGSTLLTTAPLLKHMGVSMCAYTRACTHTPLGSLWVLQGVSGGRWTRRVWFRLAALLDLNWRSQSVQQLFAESLKYSLWDYCETIVILAK